MQSYSYSIRFLLFFTTTILLLPGCNFSNKKQATSTTDWANSDSLPYQLFTLDTTDAACKGKYDYCTRIYIEYPIFNTLDKKTDSFFLSKIKQQILFSTDSNFIQLDAYIHDFFSSYMQFKEDMPYDGPDAGWEREKVIRVVGKKGTLLSLEYYEYMYEGGAHPNSYITFHTYNLNDLSEVRIEDYLPLNDSALLRIGEAYFRKTNEVKDNNTLEDVGYFIFGDGDDFEDSKAYGKFRFNTNFALTKEGIRFLYNTYEIGPYVVGAPEFTLPYKVIEPFLKKKLP